MRQAIISSCLIFAISVVAVAEDVPRLPDQPHIVVTGDGTVEAAADYAELVVTVTIGNEDGVQAKAAVEAQLVAVADALLEFGLEEDQMKAGATSIDVKYDWQKRPPERLGAQATRSIELSPLQIDQLDEIIRIATEAGATNISRPELRSNREAELSDQAQALAVADARARAERLANQFGRSLGPVWGIATEEARYWDWYGGSGGGGGGGLFGDAEQGPSRYLRYTPHSITGSVSVYAVFLLGPPLDEQE